MRPALNVATLNQDLGLVEFVQVAGGAGFTGVELIVPTALEGYTQEHGADGAARLFAETGVDCAHYFLGLPMHAEAQQFAEALDTAAPRCGLAVTLGMDRVGVWLPPSTERPVARARADLVARLREAAQLAGEHDLLLTVEFIGTAHAGRPLVRTLVDALAIIEAADATNLRILLDLFHFWVGGSQLADLQAMPGELLGMVHLDDAPDDDVERLRDADRVLPGEGVMPVAQMLSICAEKGYQGWASVELFGEELRALDPAQAAERSRKAAERVLGEVWG